MSLRNDGTMHYDFSGMPITPSMVLFAQADRRLKQKKMEIEDMQNEYDLLEQQAFNLYRQHVDYMKFDQSFIERTNDWLLMQKSGKDKDGNKLDRRKNYPEKTTAEYFLKMIKDYLGIDDMEVVEIIDYNFGEAKEIVFTSHGHKWELAIPIVHNVKMRSFQNCEERCFKLRLSHYDTDHCTCCVGNTFDEDELKDIMTKGIEKYCK